MSENIKINTNALKNNVEELVRLKKYYSMKKNSFQSYQFHAHQCSVLDRFLGKVQSQYDDIVENITEVMKLLNDYYVNVEALENKMSGHGGFIKEDSVNVIASRYANSLMKFQVKDENIFLVKKFSRTSSSSKSKASFDRKNPVKIAGQTESLVGKIGFRGETNKNMVAKTNSILNTFTSSVADRWDRFINFINGAVETTEIPIQDQTYQSVLGEYTKQYDDTLSLYDSYLKASEEELAQYEKVEKLLSLSDSIWIKNIGSANEKAALKLLEGKFDSLEEYQKYIAELKGNIELCKAAILEVENYKALGKYECLSVLDDFQNFSYDKTVDSNKIEIYNNEGVISFSSYEAYCKQNGEVSKIEFVKAVREKVGRDWFNTSATEEMKQIANLIDASSSNLTLEKTYNYLFENYGQEVAKEYLFDMEGTVNNILGQRKAEQFLSQLTTAENIDNAVLNHLKVSGKGLQDGGEMFLSGLGHSFSSLLSFVTDIKPSKSNTIEEFESMYILQALQNGDYGSYIHNNYEISQGIGNMLPSIALSYVNPVLGSAALGVSAGGNSYHSALTEGYNNVQALTYGIISGSTEVVTERVLGGIPGLSDVRAVDLKSFVHAMMKEANEEGVQAVMDAYLRKGVFGEEIDAEELKNNVTKSAIYGGITAGILQSPSAILGNMRVRSINNALESGIITDSEIREMIRSLQSDGPISNESKSVQEMIRENSEVLSNLVNRKLAILQETDRINKESEILGNEQKDNSSKIEDLYIEELEIDNILETTSNESESNLSLDELLDILGLDPEGRAAKNLAKSQETIKRYMEQQSLLDYNGETLGNIYDNLVQSQVELNRILFPYQNVPKSIAGVFASILGLPNRFIYRDVQRSEIISNKILTDGLYHLTDVDSAQKILESGMVKKSGVITSYGPSKSFFFAGQPSLEDVSINLNGFEEKRIAVKFKIDEGELANFKFREFDDQAVVNYGDYHFDPSNAEIVYLGLKEENGQLIYKEISALEYENYHFDQSKVQLINSLQNNLIVYGSAALGYFNHYVDFLNLIRNISLNKTGALAAKSKSLLFDVQTNFDVILSKVRSIFDIDLNFKANKY